VPSRLSFPFPDMPARRRRARLARSAAFLAGCLAAIAPLSASAKCPKTDPADDLCEPITSFLMPSVAGAAYFPHAAGGPYFGGGVELALLSWTSNNDAFGPSQGRLRATFTYLAGPDNRTVALYHFGGLVSFERNASRRFLIPYFSGAIGGLYQTELGAHGAIDASLGLFLVHTRSFVLDVEGGAELPFTAVEELIGGRMQLTAGFALW
jgi:hypothetical protein